MVALPVTPVTSVVPGAVTCADPGPAARHRRIKGGPVFWASGGKLVAVPVAKDVVAPVAVAPVAVAPVVVAGGEVVVALADGSVVVAPAEIGGATRACPATGMSHPGGSMGKHDNGPPTLTSVMATWFGKYPMLSSARLGMAEGFITMAVIFVWLPAEPARDRAAPDDVDL